MEKQARLQREPFTQVKPADIGILDEVDGTSRPQDLAVRKDICTICYAKGFAYIVIGYEYADTLLFKIKNYLAKVVDSKWIDTGERFVQKYELRLSRKTAGDLDAATFTTR